MFSFDAKIVKVRKKHYCHGCNKEIAIGQKVKKYTQIDDARFQHSYYCDTCEEYNKEQCLKCRICWDNETCFEGYIEDCKKENGWYED